MVDNDRFRAGGDKLNRFLFGSALRRPARRVHPQDSFAGLTAEEELGVPNNG
jgi:hypothetical protein